MEVSLKKIYRKEGMRQLNTQFGAVDPQRQQEIILILQEEVREIWTVCSTILMDGADREARLEAVEAENERLRETVRELKAQGREHVCELFTRVQALEDTIEDLSKRFSSMKL